jgi:hypothetical protein
MGILKDRQERIQYSQAKCKHFTGIHQKVCRAGVNYHELFGVAPGCFAGLPCTASPNPRVLCEKIEHMTLAEAEDLENKHEASANRLVACLSAAKDHAKSNGYGRGRGGFGSLPCPTGCGGTLQYSVASVNGHMHGRCTTPGCVNWME